MTDTQTIKAKTPRVAVADHQYLDAQGNVIQEDGESTGTGYRYTLLSNKETFDWQWDLANENERRMFALFGVKTLATNMTSQARNNVKGAASDAEQMEALRSRFNHVRNEGTWLPEREGGPAVAKIDKPKLATAIVNVLIAKGKLTESDRDSTYAAKLQMLEEDATYLRKARQVPDVAIAYAAIVGRQTATVEDL